MEGVKCVALSSGSGDVGRGAEEADVEMWISATTCVVIVEAKRFGGGEARMEVGGREHITCGAGGREGRDLQI